MTLTETWIAAVRALRAHKLRSVLTTLGIIIGVAAVILLVGMGDGLKAGYAASYAPMASQIQVERIDGSVLGGPTRSVTGLDMKALQDRGRTPDLASVTPVIEGTAMAAYGQAKHQAAVIGSSGDYLAVTDQQLEAGQMFTDQQAQQRLVVLGSDIATALFGADPDAAIGARVRLARTTFTVAGVLTSNGQNRETAIVPLQAARDMIGGGDILTQIIVKAASPARVTPAMNEIIPLMDKRHMITDATKRDYRVKNMQDRLDKMNDTLSFISVFIVAIAAISLVVGGLGVANIMLVSVTERTREIGVRKAIGAKSAAIMKQFLTEATALSGLGGLAGIVVGVGLTLAAGRLMPYLAPKYGIPVVNPAAVIIAFTVSLLIGVIAGGYPALRAAQLRPVEALRFE